MKNRTIDLQDDMILIEVIFIKLYARFVVIIWKLNVKIMVKRNLKYIQNFEVSQD